MNSLKWKAILNIGCNGKLLSFPEYFDSSSKLFSFFNKLISNNPIIVGRKTFESNEFNSKAVLIPTFNSQLISRSGVFYFNNLDLIKNFINIQIPTSIPFVLGGKHLFDSALSYCDTLFVFRNSKMGEISFYIPSNYELYFSLSEYSLEVYISKDSSDALNTQLDRLFHNLK